MNWRLEKYYFDFQDSEGRLFIGYRGRLSCGRFSLPYEALLHKRPGQDLDFKQKLSAGLFEDRGTEANWRCFGLNGHWAAAEGPQPGLKFSSQDGEINWRVRNLAARPTLRFDGREASETGLGYWEKLEMSLPPWKLPFPELRWGRFLADTGGRALVWTAWLGGAKEEKRLWSEAGELSGLHFEDEGLSHSRGRLDFTSRELIRGGSLFKNLGGALAPLARLLPGRLSQTREHKWFSRAVLSDAEGVRHDGWAVHEIVNFSQ